MQNPNLLSRRQALSALAAPTAVLAAGVALAPLSAASETGTDLLELGRKLDEAVRVWRTARPAYDAAGAAIETTLNDPENKRLFRLARSKHGSDGFGVVYMQLVGEHDAVIAHGNTLMEAADILADDILKRPSRTIADLGVQARALAWQFAQAWDGPIEDADFPDEGVRRFVETVCALAGVSPLSSVEAAHG